MYYAIQIYNLQLCVVVVGVAGERIWVELKKIVDGHFADHQLKHMIELEVAKNIGVCLLYN